MVALDGYYADKINLTAINNEMELTQNNTQISEEVNTALSELIQQLSSFGEDEINIIPFEGSWTAGELAQHMIMSNGGFAELLVGPVKVTQRNPDQRIEDIKATFLDFNIKFKSPDFIDPPKADYKKGELMAALESIRKRINDAIVTLDVTKTCLAFEIPVLGLLTRSEVLHFVLYHTQRHIHQLTNIRKALNRSVLVTT